MNSGDPHLQQPKQVAWRVLKTYRFTTLVAETADSKKETVFPFGGFSLDSVSSMSLLSPKYTSILSLAFEDF